jgi:hypothetical protein
VVLATLRFAFSLRTGASGRGQTMAESRTFSELERFAAAKDLPRPDGMIGSPISVVIRDPDRVVIVEPTKVNGSKSPGAHPHETPEDPPRRSVKWFRLFGDRRR